MEYQKIGLGATANVYRYNEKNIIKIFHENITESAIDKECEINKSIQGLGINVPMFGGRVIKDGRQAIIMEYIEGKSMFHKMFEPDADLIQLANDFALLHYRIHKCKNISLESNKIRLEKHLAYSDELEPDILDKVLRLLDTLPDGNSLCHNDFHPDNIIVSEKGLYIIDWCDASCGDPLSDVARTSMVFDCVALPDDVPREMRNSINQARKYFGTLYESAYAKLMGVDTLDIMQWKVVEAAHRIFEYKPDPQIMIYLIEDLYSKNFIDIVDEKLFQPLGIKNWEWNRDDIENMRISVDDLALFGQLYLNKGNYVGKCYFTEEFNLDSISAYTNGGYPEGKPYGYYWWIDQYQDVEYYCACGFGGQKLCIIPSLDTSIVIISKMDGPHPENNAIIRNTISLLK